MKDTGIDSKKENNNLDYRYNYTTRKFEPYYLPEIKSESIYTRLLEPVWQINPSLDGIRNMYHPSDLMIYKPSLTEPGKGVYYWLKERKGQFMIEKGHYIYAFEGIEMGFYRYDVKRTVASFDAGIEWLLTHTGEEAKKIVEEAVERIELYETYYDYLWNPVEEYDLDYYERKLEEAKQNDKRKERNFPWVKNIRK